VHTARVLTQRVGNLATSDGNLASAVGNLLTLGDDLATDGNVPTDGNPATDGNLATGRTLHEVIRATVLALGRGAGASAFRVDFFVRWAGDARQGFDGGSGCTDSGDDGCNGQSASLYLNEVELGFSAGSAIGWLGVKSKTRPTKARPQLPRAGFISAIGCPGWQLGIQPRGLIELVFDIGSARLSSTSRYARGPSAAIPRSEVASSSKWRESSQLARLQLARLSQLARVHLPLLLLLPPPPPPPPAPPRWVAGVTAPRGRGGACQTQRWFGPIGSLASTRRSERLGVFTRTRC
jgi:hypothetical protein